MNIKKALKIVLPLVLGCFFVWLMYNNSTAEERLIILNNIKTADKFWISISLLLGLISHLSRAYRWKFTLEPLGYYPKFLNSFSAVMVAYLANYGIPRSGEVLRATTMTTYEKIPFQKGFGTIIAERLVDSIFFLLFLLLALIFQFSTIYELITYNLPSDYTTILLYFFLFLILISLITYYIFKSKSSFVQKIKDFLFGFKDGLISVFTMKKKWEFLAHSVIIWTCYFFMFHVIFNSIDETINMNIGISLTCFVAGSFAVAATNGGLGSYPFAIASILLLFNYSKEAGESIGWIMWITQTALVIVLGSLAFLLLPIINRKQ